MPELPDLQVFSRNLDKKLTGKTVKKVMIHNAKKLNVSEHELQQALENHKLSKFYRDGKELHLKIGDNILSLHLMLHGKLFLFEGKNDQKFSIVELLFTDDTGLVLTDYQGIATPTLNPAEKNAPDALSATLAYLNEKLGKTKTNIKTMLLDQKVIRGIGNAYADEILWDAGISPFSASNKIPADKIKDLARSITSVLKHAEEQIIRSNPDIISGEVRDFLNIHHTKRKNSPNGAEIKIKEGTRKTYYTNEQELYS